MRSSPAQTTSQPDKKGAVPSLLDSIFGLKRETSGGGWLFAASRGDGDDGIYFAISKDGYTWTFVNEGKPVIRRTEKGELMRDPFLQWAPDGSIRMVWTWSSAGAPAAIGYSSSFDLLHWAQHRRLSLMAAVPGALTETAPAMYYDAAKKHWIVLWTSSVVRSATGAPEERIYSTTTADFKRFAPAKIYFDPGYNVADATVVSASASTQQFCLLFRDERKVPLEERIHMAGGPSLEGPWKVAGGPITDAWAEAPASIPVDDGLLVYYHHFHDPDGYGAAFTKDMEHWSDVSVKTTFPGGMRHGSFVHITEDEYNMLKDYYFRVTDGLEK
ncbi:MAG: hypothetical protein ABR910_03790 [Acidobacteriaceae bacterium]|jgi:hypothetical protein